MNGQGKRIYCGCGGRIVDVCPRCGATRAQEIARRVDRRQESAKEKRANAPQRRLERAVSARRPAPRRSRNPNARGWTQRVFALYGRSCVVCDARAVQGHHAVPRQTIASAHGRTPAERDALEYDACNGVPVCKRCHERHETATSRIPRAALPAGVIEWADEHGFTHVLRRVHGSG